MSFILPVDTQHLVLVALIYRNKHGVGAGLLNLLKSARKGKRLSENGRRNLVIVTVEELLELHRKSYRVYQKRYLNMKISKQFSLSN